MARRRDATNGRLDALTNCKQVSGRRVAADAVGDDDSGVDAVVAGTSEEPVARGISRAELFRRTGLLAAVAAVPTGALAPAAAVAVERRHLTALTANEAELVDAIVSRLIPADENGPGAHEAGVVYFIDRALGLGFQNISSGFSTLKDAYAANLEAVDAYARSAQGASFAGLSPAQQDAVLTDMQQNKATGFTPDSSTFFNVLRNNALQGMFGDPYWGGNAQFIGWDLLGYPGLKLVWTVAEQRIDAPVKKVHKSVADYANFGLKKTKGA
jgi:gluconate 2-dehydrogenase gamma chain